MQFELRCKVAWKSSPTAPQTRLVEELNQRMNDTVRFSNLRYLRGYESPPLRVQKGSLPVLEGIRVSSISSPKATSGTQSGSKSGGFGEEAAGEGEQLNANRVPSTAGVRGIRCRGR